MNINEINSTKIAAFKEAIAWIKAHRGSAQDYAENPWTSQQDTDHAYGRIDAYDDSIRILNELIESCENVTEAQELTA